jgi:hypothetical protein
MAENLDLTKGYGVKPKPSESAMDLTGGQVLNPTSTGSTTRNITPGGNVKSTQNDVFNRLGAQSNNLTPGMTEMDPLDAYGLAKSNIYSEYSYLTGGPNMGLIRQLTQQKKDARKRYKTNRADVENMYGQLTADVEADTTAIGQSFDTGITESAQRAQGVVAGLSAELASQQDRRNKAATELGVEKEAILSDYGSTTALNQAMGTVLGQNQNWQGFLQSQKGAALQQGADMGLAVGNTKVQTANAMKEQYDRVSMGIDNAISSERSKQAVRKLTEEGSMLLGISKQRLKTTLEQQYGLGKTETNKLVKAQQETLGYFNENPSVKWKSPDTFDGIDPSSGKKEFSAGAKGWDAMMRKNLVSYYTRLKNLNPDEDLQEGMDPYLLLYAKQNGINASDVIAGASNLTN